MLAARKRPEKSAPRLKPPVAVVIPVALMRAVALPAVLRATVKTKARVPDACRE
jgi:hypothetical protein